MNDGDRLCYRGIKRTIEPMVKNRFGNDTGAMAAWHTASHIARAPRHTPTPPTP